MTPLEMIAEFRKGCSCAGPKSGGDSKPEECVMCSEALHESLYEQLLLIRSEMRNLRRWHWQQVVNWRKLQQTTDLNVRQTCEVPIERHLGFVESLNSLFPEGDTVENDQH